jgi:outer membrane lipoprotein SlyB
MKTKHIVIIVIIVLLCYILIKNRKEGLDSTPTLSNEAIQSISSVYSNTAGVSSFNNLRATGKITGKLTGDVSGNLIGNVTGNVTGNVKGDLSGNMIGNLNGNLISPDGKYKLSIDNKGALILLNNDGNSVNIRGKYSGRFYSPKGDYYVKVHNDDEKGIFAGYQTNGDKLVAGVENSRELVAVYDEYEGVTR